MVVSGAARVFLVGEEHEEMRRMCFFYACSRHFEILVPGPLVNLSGKWCFVSDCRLAGDIVDSGAYLWSRSVYLSISVSGLCVCLFCMSARLFGLSVCAPEGLGVCPSVRARCS